MPDKPIGGTDVQEQAVSAIQAIPFDNIIGGPLSACVKAQADASQTTLNYLHRAAMHPSETDPTSWEPEMIVFSFMSEGKKLNMKVPLMTILPIPYMHIDQIDLSFTADITATSTNTLTARYSNESLDEQRDADGNLTAQHLIGVDIKAGTADMPAGLAKMIEVFNEHVTHVEKVTPKMLADEAATRAAADADSGSETEGIESEPVATISMKALEALRAEYDQKVQELAQTQAELTNRDQQLATAQSSLTAKEKELSSKEKELTNAQQQLSNTQTSLTNAQQQLSNTQTSLTKTQQQLSNTQTQLSTAQNDLKTAQTQIKDMQAQAAAFVAPPYNSADVVMFSNSDDGYKDAMVKIGKFAIGSSSGLKAGDKVTYIEADSSKAATISEVVSNTVATSTTTQVPTGTRVPSSINSRPSTVSRQRTVGFNISPAPSGNMIALVKSADIKVGKTFEAEVKLYSPNEGGQDVEFSVNSNCEFCFYHAKEVEGSFTAITGSDTLRPGELRKVTIKLAYNMPLCIGDIFSVMKGCDRTGIARIVKLK